MVFMFIAFLHYQVQLTPTENQTYLIFIYC